MVTSILAVLLTSICGIYIAMIHEWQRQQGQGDATVCISRTFSSISSEISQAVTVYSVVRSGQRDNIIYTLPLDRDATNSYYIPAWVGGSLQYRPGQQKVFYLSNSTGNWNSSGNILWRGLVSGAFPNYTIIPDPSWDADVQRGRIAGLSSLRFATDNWGEPKRVTITATTSYKVMNSTAMASRSLAVCLRNAN